MIFAQENQCKVNSCNIYNWAQDFVVYVSHLTPGGRRVLHTYDGSRSPMTLEVLQLFDKHKVIVHALLAHTSKKTQPCNAGLFSIFHGKLRESLQLVASEDKIDLFDMFDYYTVLQSAFNEAFTRRNIRASFEKSGIWPIDPSRFLSVLRPHSAESIGSMDSAVGHLIQSEHAR